MTNKIFISSSQNPIGQLYVKAFKSLFPQELDGFKMIFDEPNEHVNYDSPDKAKMSLRAAHVNVNIAVFIITYKNGVLDLEYIDNEIYGVSSFVPSSHIFVLLPYKCQIPNFDDNFRILYYKNDEIQFKNYEYEIIINQWTSLIMSYPASEILVRVRKENKLFLSNLEKVQQFSSSNRFKVALTFCGEYREAIVYPIVNGLLRFFKEEEILYDEFMKEELASVALDDYLSCLYTNQSDIIVLFGCDEYSKKHWPQIEWEAINNILLNNINKNRNKVLIFSIDGKLPPPLFPESDGYILLKETGDDIGKAVNFIVERYTKYMGGCYK